MNYLLDRRYRLCGWKNRPWCIYDTKSPAPPLEIDERTVRLLSEPVPADPQGPSDPFLKELVRCGVLRPAAEGERLLEEQRFHSYGCLHFLSVIYSITGRCNYRCLHCSVSAPVAPMKEIPLARIGQQLDEMKDCGLKNIVLIGGEPLIRSDFLQIVDAVLVRGMFVVEIFTNGSLVSKTLLDALEERGIRPLFMVSFDGVGYHDIMRGVEGAEARFYETIALLRSRGFPVSCNMCITKDSIHSLWDTIRTLADRGVQALTVYPPVECGLWKERYQEMGASLDLVADVYEDVIERYVAADYPLDLNLYGMLHFNRRARRYAVLPNWSYDPEKAATSPACRIYRQELNISPEGVLSPCYAIMSDDYIRTHMPHLDQMPLKEALTDSPFTRIMELTAADIMEHNPRCRACAHLSQCAGGCRMSAFEKTGDLLGYDPQMCHFFENGHLERFRNAISKGRFERFLQQLV